MEQERRVCEVKFVVPRHHPQPVPGCSAATHSGARRVGRQGRIRVLADSLRLPMRKAVTLQLCKFL